MAVASISNIQGPSSSTMPFQASEMASLSVEEEDNIIHTRITNDERPLRRVVKKFHSYAAVAFAPVIPIARIWTDDQNTMGEAREALLVELASFELFLRKSAMICEAEARQVEEYNKEREQIEHEHGTLRSHIGQLKIALEHEQMLRRRKIEYDLVAEKVNTLPSRAELELSISALENDTMAIRTEHETQNRMIQGHKAAFDNVISNLVSLQLMGKDKDASASVIPSPSMTPVPEGGTDVAEIAGETEGKAGGVAVSATSDLEKEMSEEERAPLGDVPSNRLNPTAKVFHPTAVVSAGAPSSTIPTRNTRHDDDIEMGEVAEPRYLTKAKRNREDLEEGEASDSSSALSEPPDD